MVEGGGMLSGEQGLNGWVKAIVLSLGMHSFIHCALMHISASLSLFLSLSHSLPLSPWPATGARSNLGLYGSSVCNGTTPWKQAEGWLCASDVTEDFVLLS